MFYFDRGFQLHIACILFEQEEGDSDDPALLSSVLERILDEVKSCFDRSLDALLSLSVCKIDGGYISRGPALSFDNKSWFGADSAREGQPRKRQSRETYLPQPSELQQGQSQINAQSHELQQGQCQINAQSQSHSNGSNAPLRSGASRSQRIQSQPSQPNRRATQPNSSQSRESQSQQTNSQLEQSTQCKCHCVTIFCIET